MKKSEYVNKILHLQNDFNFQYVWTESELNELNKLDLQCLYQSKLSQLYYGCLDLSQISNNQDISNIEKDTILCEPLLKISLENSKRSFNELIKEKFNATK